MILIIPARRRVNSDVGRFRTLCSRACPPSLRKRFLWADGSGEGLGGAIQACHHFSPCRELSTFISRAAPAPRQICCAMTPFSAAAGGNCGHPRKMLRTGADHPMRMMGARFQLGAEFAEMTAKSGRGRKEFLAAQMRRSTGSDRRRSISSPNSEAAL